jgi:hypothetical protein
VGRYKFWPASNSHLPPPPSRKRGPNGARPPGAGTPSFEPEKEIPKSRIPRQEVESVAGTVEFGKSSPLFRTRVEADWQHQGRHSVVIAELALGRRQKLLGLGLAEGRAQPCEQTAVALPAAAGPWPPPMIDQRHARRTELCIAWG